MYMCLYVCVCLSVCDTIVTQFILSKSQMKEDSSFIFIFFAKNQFNYQVYTLYENVTLCLAIAKVSSQCVH